MTGIDDRRAANVTAAQALAQKLRTPNAPLKLEERLAAGNLVADLAYLLATKTTTTTDRELFWSTVEAMFDVRLRLLRGDHDDTGGTS